jgi:pseudoazurin
MRMLRSGLAALAVALWLMPANAAEHEVRMLNQGPDGMMQYSPQLLRIVPGDSVHFVAADKGHNVQSIDGMIPQGAAPFSSPVGQDFTISLTVPGVYGYRCAPHGTLGMVGLIVVGSPVNEDAAKSAAMPGMAGHVFAKLFQSLDSNRTAAK